MAWDLNPGLLGERQATNRPFELLRTEDMVKPIGAVLQFPAAKG